MLDPNYELSGPLNVVDFCRRHAMALRFVTVLSPGLTVGFWLITADMDLGLFAQVVRYHVAASVLCGPLCGLLFALAVEPEASWDERIIEFLLLVSASVVVAIPVAGTPVILQLLLTSLERSL